MGDIIHLVSDKRRGKAQCGKSLGKLKATDCESTATCRPCLESRAVRHIHSGNMSNVEFVDIVREAFFGYDPLPKGRPLSWGKK